MPSDTEKIGMLETWATEASKQLKDVPYPPKAIDPIKPPDPKPVDPPIDPPKPGGLPLAIKGVLNISRQGYNGVNSRDKYVTSRDGSGQVLDMFTVFHIDKEFPSGAYELELTTSSPSNRNVPLALQVIPGHISRETLLDVLNNLSPSNIAITSVNGKFIIPCSLPQLDKCSILLYGKQSFDTVVTVWVIRKKGTGGESVPPTDPNPKPVEPPVPVRPPSSGTNPPVPNPISKTYRENPANVPSVGRGIVETHEVKATNPSKRWGYKGTMGYRLILTNNKYRLTRIGEDFIDAVSQTFQDLLDFGATADVLPCYWFNDYGISGGEAQRRELSNPPLSKILQDIGQMASVYEKFAPIINFFKKGHTGTWGEDNKANFGLGIEDGSRALGPYRQILDLLSQVLPKERMLGLRYWEHFNALFGSQRLEWKDAYKGQSLLSRMGMFNDFWLNDYPKRVWERVGAYTRYTYMKGEGVPGSYDEARAREAIQELKACYWQGMQKSHMTHLIRLGLWPSIEKYIGYRYFLQSAILPGETQSGKILRVDLNVMNQGTGALHNPKDMILVLKNQSNGAVIKHKAFEGEEHDATRILPRPGEGKTIQLGAQLGAVPRGPYELSLHMSDVFPIIANRAAYSIPFANLDMWDTQTGYNRLGVVSIS